ncbi:MAG: threonylcarbamoyl-AMP synthase [Verrucomicrobiales bacterium]|nr:threonylcarbamoyl-AMP synthase [Verrucomicrobiales bacterium]
MAAEVLSTETTALMAVAVERAAERLRSGDVVAVPTETVYGLAANALDPAAVARIYAVKGRPAHNPVIVHVASRTMARECTSDWTPLSDRLADVFWPGPLTLVLPRSPRIPDIVTGGGSTVGIRWPQHPFMQALIRRCGFPLAAPSANLANRLSPTNASHVLGQLGDRVALVVDGGDCNVGIESTVVDAAGTAPRILRPGMIDEPALREAAGASAVLSEVVGVIPGQPLQSPGQLARHYSPRARLEVWSWRDDAELARRLAESGAAPDRTYVVAHHQVPHLLPLSQVILIPDDPEAFARALYAQLHQCDDVGAELIVVEAPPAVPAWAGVADRLRRASVRE